MDDAQFGLGNYDKRPVVPVAGDHQAWRGPEVWRRLAEPAHEVNRHRPPLIGIDTYPGVDLPELVRTITAALPDWVVVDVETAALPRAELDALIGRNLTDDRVFGVLSHHHLSEFYDAGKLTELARSVSARTGPTVVVGWGAALLKLTWDVLVLADLARWEIQGRLRAGASNWHCDNADEDILRKYKRGFFVDWRVADRHKQDLFDRIDFVLDTNRSAEDAVLITAEAFRAGLEQASRRPFRVVPFFDPGPWGGQWMRQVFGLADDAPNYAWCFDCVPEENSLLLEVGGEQVELPSLDLVFTQPVNLLGPITHSRFGPEFPIRFDFLDTMGGGNLSLQVHPLTGYIKDVFGMSYTQDESYYLLDAADDAVVYLGTKTGINPDAMVADLRAAGEGDGEFPAEKYVNTYPARKHDHFLIPAGTVHCSGANSMVLEISATPFIFTFKMWDWGRLGMDGQPRPINVDHAVANIQWDRDTEWTTANLVDRVERVAEGDGWIEERTGLHPLEFIETRRHWFTGTVPHDTKGTVNVLNLVEGIEAVVESPDGAFEPFVVHYAETFIVPAAVGRYTIRPYGEAAGTQCATIKASVRATEVPAA